MRMGKETPDSVSKLSHRPMIPQLHCVLLEKGSSKGYGLLAASKDKAVRVEIAGGPPTGNPLPIGIMSCKKTNEPNIGESNSFRNSQGLENSWKES